MSDSVVAVAFYEVGVVAAAFDLAGAAAVTPWRVRAGGDLSGDAVQDVGVGPAVGGEMPPCRWRCGG